MNTKEAHQLATKLMTTHKLHGWKFEWSPARRRFGVCSYTHKTIRLSEPLTKLNTLLHVTNVILHEIAHALAGHNQGHGEYWQNVARSIGCDGLRQYSADVIQPKALYTSLCPNGHTAQRNKKRRVSCGRCSDKFDRQYLLKYTRN